MTLNDSDTAASAGTWITPTTSYVNPQRRHCAACGRPLARRFFQAAPTSEPLPFCNPSHLDLYVSYWLPTHGPQAAPGPTDATAAND